MGLLDFFKTWKKTSSGITRYNLVLDDEDKLRESWKRVEELVALGKPSSLKQAVIEADKALDFVLLKLTTGQSMGERLKAARDLFNREVYNDLWAAHKTRNSLVHEANYDPPHYICREAVNQFRNALVDLNIRIGK